MKGDCQNDVEVAKNDDVEVAVLHKRDLLDEPQRGWSTAAVADIETVSGGRQLQRGVGCRHRFVRTLLLRAIVESWYTSAVRLVLIPFAREGGHCLTWRRRPYHSIAHNRIAAAAAAASASAASSPRGGRSRPTIPSYDVLT